MRIPHLKNDPTWRGNAKPYVQMGSGEDGKAIRPKMIFPMIPCGTHAWYPYAPCMVYLPTFGWFLGHMLVNIPYMEHIWAYGIWYDMEIWQFQLLKSQLLLESIPNSCQFRSGFVQKLVKPSKMPVFRGKVISKPSKLFFPHPTPKKKLRILNLRILLLTVVNFRQIS